MDVRNYKSQLNGSCDVMRESFAADVGSDDLRSGSLRPNTGATWKQENQYVSHPKEPIDLLYWTEITVGQSEAAVAPPFHFHPTFVSPRRHLSESFHDRLSTRLRDISGKNDQEPIGFGERKYGIMFWLAAISTGCDQEMRAHSCQHKATSHGSHHRL
jgi:hypothetical protein